MEEKNAVNVAVAPLTPDETTQSRRKEPARLALRTDDWWVWEAIGVIGSALALAGLIGLVYHLNGKETPNWSQAMCFNLQGKTTCHQVKISVNSVISWMSSIAKICVMIPITKAIGQLKWVWFTGKERSLSDFEAFDSATRGLTGSAMLIWRLRGRHLAALGGAAVVLSLAFEPFIQNLVTYGVKWVPGDKTQVQGILAKASTFGYTGDYANPDPSLELVDPTLDLAIASYINPGLSFTAAYTPWSWCDTSNCTWNQVVTLGVSGTCGQISEDLVIKDCPTGPPFGNSTQSGACEFSLTNGVRLTNSGETTVMAINASSTPVLYTNLSAEPLATIQVLAAFNAFNLNESSEITAIECVFEPAVYAYDSPSYGASPPQGDSVGPPTVTYDENYAWMSTNYTYEPGKGAWIDVPEIQLANKSDPRRYNISDLGFKTIRTAIQKHYEGSVYVKPNSSSYGFRGAESTMQTLYQKQDLVYILLDTSCSDSVIQCHLKYLNDTLSKVIAERPYLDFLGYPDQFVK